MSDGTFILSLNERLQPEERLFKLSSAELSKGNILTVTLIMKATDYDKYISDKSGSGEETPLRKKVDAAVEDIVRKSVNDVLPIVSVAYKKASTDAERVKTETLYFFKNDRKLLAPKIADRDIEVEVSPDRYISVKINVSEATYGFCRDNRVAEALKEKLDTIFMEDSEVEFKVTKVDPIIAPPDYTDTNTVIRHVHYTEPVKLYGNITIEARYISDILELKKDVAKVCITGQITSLKERSKKADPSSKFYLFRLDDKSGIIDVKFFPKNETSIGAAQMLEEGQHVVVEGPLRYDSYSECFAVTVFSIAKINVDYNSQENAKKYKSPPANYSVVNPTEYVETESYNVSIYDTPADEKPAEFLMGKTFVVFDTETTGLTLNSDEVIEIGAVKIVDGKLTEQFSTFVKPINNTISEKITELTHISNDDVKDAPTFDEIAGDFSKFTEGAILVAYNANFDIGMMKPLMRHADYDLPNEVIDALKVAQDSLSNLKNYKLGTVADALEVSLEGAHRAVNDAIATAKVFRKLAHKL